MFVDDCVSLNEESLSDLEFLEGDVRLAVEGQVFHILAGHG